jgi:aryl-alcohol dehydrogenase-like predicted oxidoreductase
MSAHILAKCSLTQPVIGKVHIGECSEESAIEIMDYFFDQGGNFIDNSPNYQNEESEIWIGEWLVSRGIQDQMVIATKFTTNWQTYRGWEGRINSNFGGNSVKSMHLTVENSLRNLQTSYIDIVYIHCWDHTTSVEELMLTLNDLIRQGKVLYLDASDCPAWYVAKCNQYARDHGLRGFEVYQGQWSAAHRSFQSDVLSLCRKDAMAITPWGALGSGEFKSKAQLAEDGRSGTTAGVPQRKRPPRSAPSWKRLLINRELSSPVLPWRT